MWFRRKPSTPPPPEANVIRMPATGCPEGWITVPELFVDRDGNVSDGCALPGVPPRYDEKGLLVKVGTPFFYKPLAPGETMRLQLVAQAWADQKRAASVAELKAAARSIWKNQKMSKVAVAAALFALIENYDDTSKWHPGTDEAQVDVLDTSSDPPDK